MNYGSYHFFLQWSDIHQEMIRTLKSHQDLDETDSLAGLWHPGKDGHLCMPIPTLPFTTLYGSAGKHQQLSKCGEALHRSWYQRGSVRPVLNGTSDPPAPVHLSPTKLQTHRTYCYSVYQHRLTHPIKTDITLNSRNTCLNPATLRWATQQSPALVKYRAENHFYAPSCARNGGECVLLPYWNTLSLKRSANDRK